jgi:CMP/dCMP kinase
MQKPFQIAIDGPVAAGKGTVSRLVADRLGYLYIDTGAMYRALAYKARQGEINLTSEDSLVKLLQSTVIELHLPTDDQSDSRLSTVLLDGEDVSWQIRTEQCGKDASDISASLGVRQEMVALQQQLAQEQSVVMEGRDITTVVLPNANLKVYLTAHPLVRAKRRHLQLLVRGIDVPFEQVYEELVQRDKDNIERAHGSLMIHPEALVIDTSDLAILQVVDIITSRVYTTLK